MPRRPGSRHALRLRRVLRAVLVALPLLAIVVVGADVLLRYVPALRALRDGQSAAMRAERILRSDPAHLTRAQLDDATVLLRQASEDFDAKSTIVDRGWLADFAAVLPWAGDQVDVVRTLRRAGIAATRLGLDAIPVLSDILADPAGTAPPVTRILASASDHHAALNRVRGDLSALAEAVRQLPTHPVPGPLRQPQVTIAAEMPNLQSRLQPLSDILSGVAAAGAGRHTFLLLLTNPGEERPGGGFIGALGQLTISDGQVVSTTFRASDFANSIVTNLPAPPALDRYLFKGAPWQLSDANWWADFPTSAHAVSSFYQLATGQKVDGVISVDPVALGLVLHVLGPVRVSPFPQVITADNALREINYIINKARPDDPGKVYLAPLGQTVLDHVLHASVRQYPALASALASAVHGKHIAMVFDDQRLQQVVDRYDAGARLGSTGSDDGLLVADANLSGSKADLFVTRQYDLTAAVDTRGTVHDNLRLEYQNAAPTSSADRNLLPGSGGAYRDYVRAYLPASATVDRLMLVHNGSSTEVSPESIATEQGRLVVAYYLILAPGEGASLEIDYHGPFAHRRGNVTTYRLAWNKQTDALSWPVHVTVVTDHQTRQEGTTTLDSDHVWSFTEASG